MNFIKWFFASSADPEKLSATVAGIATVAVAYAATYLPIICSLHLFCLDQSVFSQVVSLLAQIIEGIAGLTGLLMTLYGLIRKYSLGRWSAA